MKKGKNANNKLCVRFSKQKTRKPLQSVVLIIVTFVQIFTLIWSLYRFDTDNLMNEAKFGVNNFKTGR